MFERAWLYELASAQNDIEIAETYDPMLRSVAAKGAVIVFNHSVNYEAYLHWYDENRVPYVAIHLSDETLGDSCDYLKSPMCLHAFRNYHTPSHSYNAKVTTVGLGYKTGFTTTNTDTNSACQKERPWYHWGFAGNVYDERRKEAIAAFEDVWPRFLHTTRGTDFNNKAGLPITEYAAALAECKFALCPVGQGNLDSFRVYEALEAGAIPVVLARSPAQPYEPSYWHALFAPEPAVPFVIGDTWADCRAQVLDLLATPETYQARRLSVLAFWAKWKNIWGSQLREAMAELATRIEATTVTQDALSGFSELAL